MMKKSKGVVDSSPSYAVDEEAKARRKHQILMQDFDELEKETESTKKRLLVAKQKKLILSAEVRFLRRRYKYLMKNPLQKTPSEQIVQPQNPKLQIESTARERNFKAKEAAARSQSPVLDLNQISVPEAEETGEFQVVWEPLRVEKKLKRPSIERDAMGSDMKKLICRDIGNGSNRTGKRKISWQDQVALRV
ncbi:uncharacterized protein LOC131217025 [Magnolia sinica]|uniref:uncharacterized protein LOC131217025 n=1 Tax=Magnolia sinica TaxID=86752 RepID=UPI0026591AC2|nr:uncharacterized protein LOC131217025 [Magnolia sinica]